MDDYLDSLPPDQKEKRQPPRIRLESIEVVAYENLRRLVECEGYRDRYQYRLIVYNRVEGSYDVWDVLCQGRVNPSREPSSMPDSNEDKIAPAEKTGNCVLDTAAAGSEGGNQRCAQRYEDKTMNELESLVVKFISHCEKIPQRKIPRNSPSVDKLVPHVGLRSWKTSIEGLSRCVIP